MKEVRALLLFLFAATAARVAFITFTDPSPQEAYYFLCSQRLAPAYFDGPAGTAFVTSLTSTSKHADIIWRLTAPIWAFGATLACFGLVRQMADATRASFVALLLNALPIFNSSALRVGPELPALTFVLLGMLSAWRASGADAAKVMWWTSSGLCFGLGAWFSYASLAPLPGLVWFALSNPKRRKAGDFYGICALLALPALCLAWPLVWNAKEEWIPLAGGTLRTLWEFNSAAFLNSLWRLLVDFSPLLFPAIVLGWLQALGECRKGHLRARFIAWSAIPCVLIGSYFTYRGGSGALYFLFVAPLLLCKALDLFASRTRFVAALRGSAVLLAIGFSVYAIFAAWQKGRGWRTSALETRTAFMQKLAEGQDDIFLIAEDAELASVLGYHLRNDFVAPAGHPTVYVRESQDISNQFALWPTYADFTSTDKVIDEYFTEQQAENAFLGRSALYITHERAGDLPQSITAAFDSVVPFRELAGAGGDPRPLYIYLCLVYQTLPL
ncbi:MAG TPA: glycosyltransferase family 39 protein [Terrimicrobiaceae bacterium]